jgi:MFS family permease/ketosteroid isomerase-like protein
MVRGSSVVTERATLPPPARPRSNGHLGVALVAAVIFATLFASSLPTPLYRIYEDRWHFSSVVLTLIYAVYALAALTALLLVGPISDDVGRRPVLVVGLVGLLASAFAFAVADSTAMLFIARSVQGFATGTLLGTTGATLVDLTSRQHRLEPGLVNGVASAFGLAIGAPVAAVLIQFAPNPRIVPFVVQGILCLVLIVAVLRLDEPAVVIPHRSRMRPTPPYVPPEARGPFVIAALGALASWSVAALLLSLGPQLAAGLVGSTNALPGGWATLIFAGSAGLAQMTLHRLSDRTATTGGSLFLALGVGIAVVSLPDSSLAFFVGLSLTGGGFGLVFMGGLRALTRAAPSQHRASVMAAFYIAAYLSLSVPAVLAGLVATEVGIVQTFRIFGVTVIGIALCVGFTASRLQRRSTGITEAVEKRDPIVPSTSIDDKEKRCNLMIRPRDPKEVVRQYVTAVETGDEQALREVLAEDAIWTLRAGQLPISGAWEGRETIMGEFLATALSYYKPGTVRLEITSMIADHDQIVLQWTSRARTREGEPYENDCIGVFTVRDGRISAVREYMDTLSASFVFAAAGKTECAVVEGS